MALATLVLAAGFVSCQNDELEPTSGKKATEVTGNCEITAVFETSKVSYEEIDGQTPGNVDLLPSWEVGDVVFGFDDYGNDYTFTVYNISDSRATLRGEAPENATLHLIHAKGYGAGDLYSDTFTTVGEEIVLTGEILTVDYTGQKGDKSMPAVMTADGQIKDYKGEFTFSNAGAVVGIDAVNGVPAGSVITKVSINGENLSEGVVSFEGRELRLNATEKENDSICVGGLNLIVIDAEGTLSAPVLIAVPTGAKIAKVTVSVAKEPETMKIPSTAAGKKNIDYVEIEAKYDGENLSTKKWAKWNVGASSEKDYGWYFFWAGTEGYVYKNSQWVSASGIEQYSYTTESVTTANANHYLYVKTQSLKTVRHSFNWVSNPYQTQNTTDDSSTKFTKYLGSTSSSYKDPSATDADALKTILDPEDDAAHVNWGGTWRMPTDDEFKALYNATKWTWDSSDKGYYVTKSDETLCSDKSNALLFFPAAGFGWYANFYNAGSLGYYWSSTLCSSKPYYACRFRFFSSTVYPQDRNIRFNGFPVRPLSDL